MDVLNFTAIELGSVLSLPNTFVVTFMSCLALAGNWARKTRHDLAAGVKGLNLVEISEMYLVIIVYFLCFYFLGLEIK